MFRKGRNRRVSRAGGGARPLLALVFLALLEPDLIAAPPGGDDRGAEIALHASETHWSFLPIADPEPPAVADPRWAKHPIDRFIAARRSIEGLVPAPCAERGVLLRRLAYTLTGLPPAPDELAAFLADTAPGALERACDRFLASPRYGERQAREWLDLVRYADTSGCNADVPIPEAWRYRNWVIRAFDADLPYDRFVSEQIAGDLLAAGSGRDSEPAAEEERYDEIVATGYLAISRRFSSLGEEFHLTIGDTIDNVGQAILGLTLGCARCHDHKFDPIPTRDYYALYGIFQSTRYAFPGTEIPRHSRDMVPLVPEAERRERIEPYLREIGALDREMDALYAEQASLDTGSEKDRVKKAWRGTVDKRDKLVEAAPRYPRAYAVQEGDVSNARIHVKGDPAQLGEEVPRGFLSVLGGMRVPPDSDESGRRELAAWLTSNENPLTARVMVNRIWQQHFGEGIVRTPNDFGARGLPPTHPELLDWLASRFIESGYSVKAMHRLIVSSETWSMASSDDVENLRRDPDNRFLWRFSRRRLTAEEIRDSILAAGGVLDLSRGGPHPFPPEWEWRYTQHNPFIGDFDTHRRSIFLLQQRIRPQPFLGLFDGADPNASTGERTPSATPGQALFFLNGELAHEAAERFAERVLSRAETTPARLDSAFRLALSRPASPEEIEIAREYFRSYRRALSAGAPEEVERAAWASYLRVLLSSNEFLFVE